MFGDMPLPAKFFIAFVIVLALIGGVAWLVRRYGAGGLSASSVRGRQARLGVIEAAAVDSRRRLVLVRRDNVEHLVMLGGPSDLVIEANIVRAQATARELPPQRSAEAAGLPATGDGMWPAAPEPPLRPGRGPERPAVPPPFDELPLQPHPEPAPRVQADRGPGLGADIGRSAARSEPPFPRAMTEPHRSPAEPRRPFATPSRASEETHSTDRHLAAMAHQLEAALRRSGATPGRDASPELPGVRRPGAEPRPRAEAREPRSSLLERAMQARSSASFAPVRAKAAEAPAVHADAGESAAAATSGAPESPPPSPPSPDSAAAAAPEPAAEAGQPSQQDKGQTEASAPAEDKPPASIEEEMANLLGRAPGKS
jgi:flagellar protein FliO/FliZ